MFRSQYDTDVTTFSPAGRLHQVEYAMEAVKQGSCVVGICSKNFAVLAAYRRHQAELASHQKKLFKIDNHIGIGISGLVADARGLARFMRTEALNHKYVYNAPMPSSRLVTLLSDKSQVYTQTSAKRPYGVGLLVIGADKSGIHLFETSPSGVFFEYIAHAFGSRSQSAKTYIERHVDEFKDLNLDELIKHALTALKGTIADGELTSTNCEVAFVAKDRPFTILQDETLEPYVDQVVDEAEAEAGSGAAMQDDE
uniref:Proteasome subunit alpha type n=1 Tax=Hirondellea gigas TaxID=1518452 RepID=A0A6A7FYM4_9CRUS